MKLLHIDSSITGAYSVSRQLTAAIVQQLVRTAPDLAVSYRDLANDPLPQLSPGVQFAKMLASHAAGQLNGEVANAIGAAVEAGAKADPVALVELAAGNAALEEFLAADIIVIGAPLYNFSVPSQLKTWLDALAVPGKTFSYSANGVQGLAGDKRVIIASARGGVYTPPSPMAALDHQETYLQGYFGFIGVTDLQIIRAEGGLMGPDQYKAAMEGALAQVAQLSASVAG